MVDVSVIEGLNPVILILFSADLNCCLAYRARMFPWQASEHWSLSSSFEQSSSSDLSPTWFHSFSFGIYPIQAHEWEETSCHIIHHRWCFSFKRLAQLADSLDHWIVVNRSLSHRNLHHHPQRPTFSQWVSSSELASLWVSSIWSWTPYLRCSPVHLLEIHWMISGCLCDSNRHQLRQCPLWYLFRVFTGVSLPC